LGTRASCLFLLLAGLGCGFHDEPLVPLYPGDRLGPGQVATLGGYVAWVDGRDVSALGGAFELLPGCHVVTTPTHWGSMYGQGGRSASTGAVTFAVPMQPGYHYLVVSTAEGTSGPTFHTRTRVDETDPAGNPVRTLERVKTAPELTACRRAQAGP